MAILTGIWQTSGSTLRRLSVSPGVMPTRIPGHLERGPFRRVARASVSDPKAATPSTRRFSRKESLTMTGNPSSVIAAAVFDTKPYDREALQQASANRGIEWHFLEFRLTEDSAYAAKNARAVCVFVNDQLNRPCLEVL